MREGTIIGFMLVANFFAALVMIGYCLCLSRKYSRIESDRLCRYKGTVYKVIDIVYNSEDWFMRKARLQTDSYPYVVEVFISDVRIVDRNKD